MFLLLAHTGLRPGEAFALQWENVDLVGRRLRVARALSAGRIGAPKTGAGRAVDISEMLATALKRLRIARRRQALERGWQEIPIWVFCTEAGTPLDESRARKNFAEALSHAAIGSFRLYDGGRERFVDGITGPQTRKTERRGHQVGTNPRLERRRPDVSPAPG